MGSTPHETSSPATPPLTTPLFVFGTLLDQDVATLLCGQSLLHNERRSASLPGFEARYVKDITSPVLVIAPSSIVYGDVVPIETEFLSKVVELWKGEYELCPVSVKLQNGSDCQCAYFSYVGFSDITSKQWQLDEWQLKHKREYLKMISAMLN